MGRDGGTPTSFPLPKFTSIGSYLTPDWFREAGILVKGPGFERGQVDPGDRFVDMRIPQKGSPKGTTKGSSQELSLQEAFRRVWERKRDKLPFAYADETEFFRDVARHWGGQVLARWRAVMDPYDRGEIDAATMGARADALSPRIDQTCTAGRILLTGNYAGEFLKVYKIFICDKTAKFVPAPE